MDNEKFFIESYALEIISRARAIKGKCEQSRANDFINNSPETLINTIVRTCNFMEHVVEAIYKKFDWSGEKEDIEINKKLLFGADNFVCGLGWYLSCLDLARTENLPWSIIPRFQKLADKLFPNTEILFLPEYDHNYRVFLSDVRSNLKNILETSFSSLVPDVDIEKEILADMKHPYFIITFPLLERKNIRLHTLLGHEFGHLLVGQYLTKTKKDEFSKEILAYVQTLIDKNNELQYIKEKEPLIYPLILQKYTTDYMEVAVSCWERCLEEVLSDIVCAILFGPAAIFAAFEIATMQNRLDLPTVSKETEYYPPWRMRLSNMIKVLKKDGKDFFPVISRKELREHKNIKNVDVAYSFIEQMANDEIWKTTLTSSEVGNVVYSIIDKYIEEGTRYLLDNCNLKSHAVNPDKLYAKLPELITRLNNKIPPNAIEIDIVQKGPAELVEIINSAWFYKLTWGEPFFSEQIRFNEELYKQRNRMNELTLKAIEYSFIEERYLEEKRKKNDNANK